MQINEILPNPVGVDTAGEWIELVNTYNIPVQLAGWYIRDASGKTFTLASGTLNSGGYKVFSYKTTKIILNNNGETLSLHNPNGELIDEFQFYGVPQSGWSVARISGNIVFVDKPTPESENQFRNETAQLSSLVLNKTDTDMNVQNTGIHFQVNIFLAALLISFSLALLGVFIIRRIIYEEKT